MPLSHSQSWRGVRTRTGPPCCKGMCGSPEVDFFIGGLVPVRDLQDSLGH